MKILFGIPDQMHRELADLEIKGIAHFNPDSHLILYGPVDSKKRLINKIPNTLSNAFLIRKVLNKRNYDILFLNTAFDRNAIIRDCITLFILKPLKTKVFLKFHGSNLLLFERQCWWQKKLIVWLFKNVDGVGVLSEEERNTFILQGLPAAKIFIVKNPIDPSIYKKVINFKTDLGISNEAFIFIFCGRFIPQKGIMDVLKAFMKIQEEKQSVFLICIGDGPEMGKARSFVENYNLEDRVLFTGFIPEVEIKKYYSNADALVFPTYHQEGFPMVVFQSLAAGLPIITTRIRASADYLTEPDNVIWVKPKNPENISIAMKKLLSDQDTRKLMNYNNKKLSYQFTTEKNAFEYLSIFEELLKR